MGEHKQPTTVAAFSSLVFYCSIPLASKLARSVSIENGHCFFCNDRCWLFVGMTGFEPATTRPPDAYSNRAELHPVLFVPYLASANLLAFWFKHKLYANFYSVIIWYRCVPGYWVCDLQDDYLVVVPCDCLLVA